MGLVYRAKDLASGTQVALKLLRILRPSDASRFSREASLLAQISHPGIVRYLAHGITEDGQHYLAMEWLRGDTLAARLAKQGLTIRESVGILRLVSEALHAVHLHGVVHRDITPRNLMFEQLGGDRLKLVDFGIARQQENLDITKTGMVIGSPGYMAPEQARGEKNLDARADIFSIGCILYQCLTGRPPFLGDPVAVRIKILMGDPLSVRELNKDVSVRLDGLVRSMLAKNPAERPSSAEQLALQLADLREVESPTRRRSAPQFTTVETSVLPVGGAAAPDIAPAAMQRFRFLILLGATSEERPFCASDSALASLAASHGAQVDQLGDTARIVKLEMNGSAPGAADRMVRLARELRFRDLAAPIALVADCAGAPPAEGMIDRASNLLSHEAVASLFAELAEDRPSGPVIRLDQTALALLDGRYDVFNGPAGAYLRLGP